jgi:hypothetical protein
MRSVTLVYAYYDNPGMLSRQFEEWARIPAWERARTRVVVVDDGSPRWPAIDVSRPVSSSLPPLSLYRVLEDLPWHQDGARNLGAHVAGDGWLFLSDMDHVLPLESLQRLFKRADDPKAFYTFARTDAATGLPMLDRSGNPKPHPNSYAMTRELYWQAGGYDEDFCGVYGTDGAFRKQLLRVGYQRHLPDVTIVRYSREVIPDASTTTLDRKAYGGPANKAAAWLRKRAAGRGRQIVTLNFEWEQQL